jgi:hypothetical protein
MERSGSELINIYAIHIVCQHITQNMFNTKCIIQIFVHIIKQAYILKIKLLKI